MEYWDLFTPDGQPTGLTMPSTERIPDAYFTKIVHVFICNRRGEFLLQKRSMRKKYFPGVWDSTGGRVLTGESCEDAVIREVREEVGLTIQPEDVTFVQCRPLPWRNFFNVYAVRTDFELCDCVRQEEEVDALQLLPYSDALALFMRPENEKDAPYIEDFKNAAATLGIDA